DDDRRYERLEAAYRAECATERATHTDVVRALLNAAQHPSESTSVHAFGAEISITITPDAEGLHVVEMSWDFASFDQQDRFPMDVLAMVPDHESIDVWDYIPPRSDSDSPHTWYTYAPDSWVVQMATSAELDQLL